MKFDARQPGIIVSGAVHAGALLVALVVFADTPKFDPAQETLPIEVLTDQQFNEITQGQKTAEEKKPLPPVASKIADIPEPTPAPTRQEAKVDVPTPPPPPLRHLPEPEPEDTPPVPTPPQRVAALPPPRPAEPPKPQVQPPPRPVEPPKAEAIEPPKPPERPKPEAKETPRPPDKPKVDPKNDQLAKLIDAKKPDAPKPPAARPRSADATDQQPRFDASSIAQALSREPAQQRAATGRTLSQTASIGSPTANAPRMSPSLWGQLDGYLQEQYKQCWNNLGLSPGQKYIPQIKVTFAQNGGLIGAPELLNRSSDQNMRSIAESALRAVKKCDPLRIPPQYAPYYNEWRIRILRFDPAEMAG